MKLTTGAVIKDAGSTERNKTGGWRALRPVWDSKKCNQCMLCWEFCPDTCIPAMDGKRLETDLDYCKGCGICANVCPVKCITMVKEEK